MYVRLCHSMYVMLCYIQCMLCYAIFYALPVSYVQVYVYVSIVDSQVAYTHRRRERERERKREFVVTHFEHFFLFSMHMCVSVCVCVCLCVCVGLMQNFVNLDLFDVLDLLLQSERSVNVGEDCAAKEIQLAK